MGNSGKLNCTRAFWRVSNIPPIVFQRVLTFLYRKSVCANGFSIMDEVMPVSNNILKFNFVVTRDDLPHDFGRKLTCFCALFWSIKYASQEVILNCDYTIIIAI